MRVGLSHFVNHLQILGAPGTEVALLGEVLMAKMVLSARALTARALTVERALTARTLTVERALTGEALAERTHTAGDLTAERALTTERALTAGILTRRQADLTAAKRVHLRKAVMFQCTRDGVGAGLLFARETQQAQEARRSIVKALLTWIEGTEVGRGKRAGRPTAALRVE